MKTNLFDEGKNMKKTICKITPDSSNKEAWNLAEKVRADLDRQSCPGVYMNIAMESIVKHLSQSSVAKSDNENLVEWHDKIVGMAVSMDVSTSEDDASNRIFGTVSEVMLQSCGSDEDTILAIEDGRNFNQWIAVSKKLLEEQPDWLYQPLWISTADGVFAAQYEWRQGRYPHQFDTEGAGSFTIPDVTHAMPLVKPCGPKKAQL
jgi:hypothetical protein